MAATDFTGIVLSGGASRRMGVDKAFLEIDGVPLVARVAAVLRSAGAGEVLGVGGDRARTAALGLVPIDDRWPGEGPLGGLVSGLEAAAADRAMVVACDLPDLDRAAVRILIDALGPGGVGRPAPPDAAVPVADGVWQVLHAAYRRACGPPLRVAFAAGERSIVRALSGLRVTAVTLADRDTLADVDTPEQWRQRTGTDVRRPPADRLGQDAGGR